MFFAQVRNFFLAMKSACTQRVDVLLACLAFVWTSATVQSVFVGASISALGLMFLVWLNGYPYRDRSETSCFAGAYRFVRYPMVLSRCLIMMGLLLASRQPTLYCVAVLILTPLYHRLSLAEDDIIARELGPVASEYRALVSGLIPQLLPAKIVGVSGFGLRESFSWRRALRAKRWEAARLSLVVVISLLGQYIWSMRIFTDFQWRSGAILLTFLAGVWFLGAFAGKTVRLAGLNN